MCQPFDFKHRFALLAWIAAVASTQACAGEMDTDDQSATSELEPCSVLTEQDVETVTGWDFDNLDTLVDASGKARPLQGMTCHYHRTNPAQGSAACATCTHDIDVVLNLSTEPGWTRELVKTEISRIDSTPDALPGLGDAAFVGNISVGPIVSFFIEVLVGKTRMELSYTLAFEGTEQQGLAQVVAMAERAASRL